MSNIKLLHILNGEDVLGEVDVTIELEDHVRVKNPCTVQFGESDDGKPMLNMTPLCVWTTDKAVDINAGHVMYEVSVDALLEERYNEVFGNVIVAPSSRIIV